MTSEMMEPRSSDSSAEPFEASEEDADAVQEPGPASVDVREQARHGPQVGGGDAGGHGAPRSLEEAEAAFAYTSAYCQNCPEREYCREDACAIWHAEKAALAIIRAAKTPVVAGVPLRASIV